MRTLKSVSATVRGWIHLTIATLVCGTVAMFTAWVPPRGSMVTLCARLWARWWMMGSGVRLAIEKPPPAPGTPSPGTSSPGVLSIEDLSLEDLPGGVFLANHVSWFDIPALILAVPGRVRFMAKRSLFRIPIFGWALAAGGFIPVDRENRSRAKESFQAALDELAGGGSLILFPEGTRSRDGRIAAFQRGGFLLALKSGLPIVPVGISGTFEVLPRTRLRVEPGPVTVRLGAPIDPATFGLRGRRQLMEVVRQQIAELSGRALRDEPPPDSPAEEQGPALEN